MFYNLQVNIRCVHGVGVGQVNALLLMYYVNSIILLGAGYDSIEFLGASLEIVRT